VFLGKERKFYQGAFTGGVWDLLSHENRPWFMGRIKGNSIWSKPGKRRPRETRLELVEKSRIDSQRGGRRRSAAERIVGEEKTGDLSFPMERPRKFLSSLEGRGKRKGPVE